MASLFLRLQFLAAFSSWTTGRLFQCAGSRASRAQVTGTQVALSFVTASRPRGANVVSTTADATRKFAFLGLFSFLALFSRSGINVLTLADESLVHGSASSYVVRIATPPAHHRLQTQLVTLDVPSHWSQDAAIPRGVVQKPVPDTTEE